MHDEACPSTISDLYRFDNASSRAAASFSSSSSSSSSSCRWSTLAFLVGSRLMTTLRPHPPLQATVFKSTHTCFDVSLYTPDSKHGKRIEAVAMTRDTPVTWKATAAARFAMNQFLTHPRLAHSTSLITSGLGCHLLTLLKVLSRARKLSCDHGAKLGGGRESFDWLGRGSEMTEPR